MVKRTYRIKETYLNYELKLVDNKNDTEELYLEPGNYTYRFGFNLPSSLPTSFEHQFGRVRYSISATIGKFNYFLKKLCFVK